MRRLLESVAEDILQLLEELTIEELEELIAYASGVLKRRRESIQPEKRKYKFKVELTSDPRKGIPYVAKLVWKENKIDRDFYSLSRQYGKKTVTVWGSFEAQEGDVIEIRKGGSWKNDYRAWYLVHKGDLYLLTHVSDSRGKVVVGQYLSGEITVEELRDELGVTESRVEFRHGEIK
jgi:hypothetical protein